jgi:REP element-mobilizing transposase RayT
MPQARRDIIQFLPDHYYHLYNRGAHKLRLFREADNYAFVIRKIQKYRQELNIAIIAYCLMPNHYHFLVRQDGESPAGLLPQRVFNSYTKAYNKRYDHSGTLFEGRYKAKHVTTDAYLLHLCRYIHANPVKDGLCEHVADWPYSNYREWIGLRNGTLVDDALVRDLFPTPEAYTRHVNDFLVLRKLPEELAYLE